MNKKMFLTVFVTLMCIGLAATPISAHVVVKPNEVMTSARTNFVVGVPTEGTSPTTGLRLLVPEGLKSVRPNVKPGWYIEVKKLGQGTDAVVTEIIWTGGAIPPEQRDEFVFSAQAPAQETNLNWKAYQTYQDGKVVAWDQDPKVVEEYNQAHASAAGHDVHAGEGPKPFSITRIKGDQTTAPKPNANEPTSAPVSAPGTTPLILSVVALGVASLSLWMSLKKKP